MTADLKKRIQAFENKRYRRNARHRHYHTRNTKRMNVWQQVHIFARHPELLLSGVKRRKLSWFGHVCRHDTVPKIILQGAVDGNTRRERPRKSRRDNIKNRMDWPVIAATLVGILLRHGHHGNRSAARISNQPG